MQTMAFAYPTRQPPPMIIRIGGMERKWGFCKHAPDSVQMAWRQCGHRPKSGPTFEMPVERSVKPTSPHTWPLDYHPDDCPRMENHLNSIG